jgi:hypothetical protein
MPASRYFQIPVRMSMWLPISPTLLRRACMRARVHVVCMRVCACVHVCMRAFFYACTCARVHVSMCACARATKSEEWVHTTIGGTLLDFPNLLLFEPNGGECLSMEGLSGQANACIILFKQNPKRLALLNRKQRVTSPEGSHCPPRCRLLSGRGRPCVRWDQVQSTIN